MRNVRRLTLLALVVSVGGYASAYAQGKCYTAVHLKDESGKALPIEPVCSLVEENLNEFCDQPPMACDFKVAPKLRKRIQLPQWRPVVVGHEMTFLESIVRAQWTNPYVSAAPDAIWEERHRVFEKALSSRKLSISQASLDLYRTNDVGTYYKVDLGDCRERNQRVILAAKHLDWNFPLVSAPSEVIPSPKAIAALKRGGEPLANFGLNGDLIRADGRLYAYLMSGHLDETDVDAGAGNAFYLDEGIRISVDGDKPRFQTRQVCKIVYEAKE